jgi:hypothetical protein
MNHNKIKTTWTVVFTILFLILSSSVSAQRRPILPQMPFDHIDKYYLDNGVDPEMIVGRRNGYDGLSVFDKSFDPLHNNVRVTVTIPAYNAGGQIMFWYPIGELYTNGFLDNKAGAATRKTAGLYPIYVFPEAGTVETFVFSNTRQAPIIDETYWAAAYKKLNPMGIREVVRVNYTEKAFSKEGLAMMDYLLKKNGYAADKTPIIKTMDDIRMLLEHEMISIDQQDIVAPPGFVIGPVIYDPRNGAIAPDAFLWMTMAGGMPLPSEEIFKYQFDCLQKTWDWCL